MTSYFLIPIPIKQHMIIMFEYSSFVLRMEILRKLLVYPHAWKICKCGFCQNEAHFLIKVKDFVSS
jgi:hypothetical protein